MGDYKFSQRSERNLQGVHPRLVDVVRLALTMSGVDFTVVEGVRALAKQREYVKKGASQTMRSKHLVQADGFGHAVDLYPWVGGKAITEWGTPWPGAYWLEVSGAMKEAAKRLGVGIVWGGDWKSFRDGPHYELTD
jgi:peptidoglycan L-alanyl-D-glutamate endopeptidase CwlK